ncbi:MAG: hypothetical protein ABL931_23745, partial [Usitatibacteraceae bacterium]
MSEQSLLFEDTAPQVVRRVLLPSEPTAATGDAGGASSAPLAALHNELAYTLTVGQARSIFAEHKRKVPAERTLQNYCTEGIISAQKIRTTFGAEWLINEASLKAYIDQQPILAAAPLATHAAAMPLDSAIAPPANSDAGVAQTPQAAAHPSETAAEPIGEQRTIAAVLIE